MSDWGIKISKEGVDVGTADINNLVLTSSIPLIKVKQEAKITLATNASTVIPHGLPYTPITWCFMNTNGTSSPGTLAALYYDFSDAYMYVDGTNLTIHNNIFATRDFYYYIFYDEIGNYA